MNICVIFPSPFVVIVSRAYVKGAFLWSGIIYSIKNIMKNMRIEMLSNGRPVINSLMLFFLNIWFHIVYFCYILYPCIKFRKSTPAKYYFYYLLKSDF